MKETRERYTKRHKADAEALKETKTQLDATNAALAAAENREGVAIDRLIERTNGKLQLIERCIMAALLGVGVLAAFDYMTSGLKPYLAWKAMLAVGGLLGLYHLIAHTMQKHVYGVSNLLNAMGPWLFERGLKGAELIGRFDVNIEAEFKSGRMARSRGWHRSTRSLINSCRMSDRYLLYIDILGSVFAKGPRPDIQQCLT